MEMEQASGAARGRTIRPFASRNVGSMLVGGGLAAALGSTLCCIVPVALFSVGATTVWIGQLTRLAPYQPIFLAAAFALLGAGFVKVYRKPKMEDCEPGTLCATPVADRLNKVAVWTGTTLVAAALAFNWIMSL